MLNREIQTDPLPKNEAFILFGKCPKCKGSLFFDFTGNLHDVGACGRRSRANLIKQ